MADVPENTGLPSVAPDIGGISVSANPERGGELLASGIKAVAESAQDLGKYYGQVAADDANNTYMEGATKIRARITALRGKAALDEIPKAQEELDTLYKDTRGSLWTGESQLNFDQISRRYRSMTQSDIEQYGASQSKIYAKETNDGTISLAKNMAGQAQMSDDSAMLAHSLDMLRKAYGKNADIEGLDGDAKASKILEADRDFAIARITSALPTNPMAAQNILQANRNVLAGSSEYETVSRQVESGVANYLTATLSQPAARAQVAPAITSKPLSAPVTEDFAADFLRSSFPKAQITSQKRSPEHNAKVGGVPNSHHLNATGIDFVDPSLTLDQVKAKLKDQGFPATEVLQEKNGSFHVAWGEKPGAAEEKSPSAEDGDDAYLATVRAKAEAAGLGPAAVLSVVKGVEANIKRDNSEQVQRTEASTRDAIAYLSTGGDPTKVALTPDQVRATVPGSRGDTLATELEAAQHYNTATRNLATAPQSDVDAILNAGPVAKSLKGGAGNFDIHTKEENAIYAAALARQKEIYGTGTTPGDPSGYVMRNFPDVGASFATATAKGSTPAHFQAFAQKTLAAQASLGIPADARRMMPTAAAGGLVTQIVTGDPTRVLPTLQGLRMEAGSYWPQLYTELSRAGLPAAYQTLSVVKDQDAGVIAAALARDAESRKKSSAPIIEAMRGVKYDDGSGGAPKSVTDMVEQSLSRDGGLSNLRATYGIFGTAGAKQFDGIYDAVRTTALYLFQTRSLAPDVAAETAAKMVTSPFDFVQQPGHAPLRLPKGAMADFRTASHSVLQALKVDDLQPYRGSTTEAGEPIGGQTKDELHAQTLQGAQHSYWIAVPGADGRGSIRAIDPQSGLPVTLKSGKPLDIPFARLPWLAQESHRKDRESIENAPVPGL